MKVLLLNGSPHPAGSTATALQEVAVGLQQGGVQGELVHVDSLAVAGCAGCGYCRNAQQCVTDDLVNQINARADEFAGLIIGSPVHYAAASGQLTGFMDRLFYSGSAKWAYKPGASVVVCRRAGTTAALDQLNKYFLFNRMPLVPSQYWAMAHGTNPQEVRQDAEGMQIMRTLGRNMAWMLQCLQAGQQAGITPPQPEPRQSTNFIR